jgi:hypothetical protein
MVVRIPLRSGSIHVSIKGESRDVNFDIEDMSLNSLQKQNQDSGNRIWLIQNANIDFLVDLHLAYYLHPTVLGYLTNLKIQPTKSSFPRSDPLQC